MQVVVVPTRIREAVEEPWRAVVVNNRAVLLQRVQDHLNFEWIRRNVETGLQTESLAKVRIGRARVKRGPHAGRPYIRILLAVRHRHAYGMRDLAGHDLVIADHAGKEGYSGRIGREPTGRPRDVGAEIESRCRSNGPTAIALGYGLIHFVHFA